MCREACREVLAQSRDPGHPGIGQQAEPPSPSGTAVATPHGIMSLRLHDRVRVDMTVDRAVRVINLKVRG